MKIITTLIFFIIASTNLYGQTYEDVINLKNGGVTRGIILEIIPDSIVKIQTVDRNIFVYKMDEVQRITKELVPAPAGNSSNTSATNTTAQAEAAKSFLSQLISSQSKNMLKLKSIEKTNGILQGEINYIYEYIASYEFLKNGYIIRDQFGEYVGDYQIFYAKEKASPYSTGEQYFSAGSIIKFKGSIQLQKTENGWRGVDNQITGVISSVTAQSTGDSQSSDADEVQVNSEAQKTFSQIELNFLYHANSLKGDSTITFKSININSEEDNYLANEIAKIIESSNRFNLQSKPVPQGESAPQKAREISFEIKKLNLKTIDKENSNQKTVNYYDYEVIIDFIVHNLTANITNTFTYEYKGNLSLLYQSTPDAALKNLSNYLEEFIYDLIYREMPIIVTVQSTADKNKKNEATKVIINTGSQKVKNIRYTVFIVENNTVLKEIGNLKLTDSDTNLCKVIDGGELIETFLVQGTPIYAISTGVE